MNLNTQNTKLLQKETAKFLAEIDVKYFVTLHFRSTTNKNKAREVVKTFLKKLEVSLFGARSKKSIISVSFIEKNSYDESFHVHILFGKPEFKKSANQEDEIYEFKKLVKTTWLESDPTTAIKELKLKSDSSLWFKEIDDRVNICNYLCKQITTGNEDVVEWDLINKDGRRKAS